MQVKGNLEITGQIAQSGSGINSLSKLVLRDWVQCTPATDDPDTSQWGEAEGGRIWFNKSARQLRWWDGTQIQVITSTVLP